MDSEATAAGIILAVKDPEEAGLSYTVSSRLATERGPVSKTQNRTSNCLTYKTE